MSVTFNKNISAPMVLNALWTHTKTHGMGALHSHNTPSIEEAVAHLKNTGNSVDYFFGKPIKTNFNSHPTYNSLGYDRDAGRGMMQEVVDGMAPHIGATPKLSEGEANDVIEEANRGITITTGLMTVSSGSSRTKQLCDWIDKNRPVNCHPQGVQMYSMLLRYDLNKGMSGIDGSPMPKFDADDMDAVMDHIVSKAEENAARKGG